MAGARGPKYTKERRAAVINALKTGCTHAAAAAAIEVHESTISRWIDKYPSFAHDVAVAEADAERRFTGVLFQAAMPHEVVETTETTTTLIKMERTRFPDGKIVEKPVPIEVTTTTTVTRPYNDWHAAESYLKRRRSGSWSDRVAIDVDTEITGLLAELAAARQDQVPGSLEEGAGTKPVRLIEAG